MQHDSRVRLAPDDLVRALILHHEPINAPAFFEQVYDSMPDLETTDAMLNADVQTILPGQLLVKMDRMSMGNSLEARSPLLDQEVMAFSAQLPVSFKITQRKQKFLLRRLARRFIPAGLAKRPKMGFAVPIERWLYADHTEMVSDILRNPRGSIFDYCDYGAVQALLDCPFEERSANSNRIWALLILEIWMQEVLLKC